LDEKEATQLARISGGRVGWAIRAATDPQVREDLENCLTMLFTIMEQDIVERFATANKLVRQNQNLSEMLEIWLTCWRDVLLFHTNNKAAMIYTGRWNRIEEIAVNADLQHTVQIICHLEGALASLQKNANKLLVIENVLLAFPNLPEQSVI